METKAQLLQYVAFYGQRQKNFFENLIPFFTLILNRKLFTNKNPSHQTTQMCY